MDETEIYYTQLFKFWIRFWTRQKMVCWFKFQIGQTVAMVIDNEFMSLDNVNLMNTIYIHVGSFYFQNLIRLLTFLTLVYIQGRFEIY